MIALVDYGLGNVRAFANIYHRLGLRVAIVDTPRDLQTADKIILPGVGAFDWAISRLNASGLRQTLDEMVLDRKVDVLGVCVGMQMMARRSDEGDLPGLGWLDAEVVRFDVSSFNHRTHLPHMGWNDVNPKVSDSLFRDMETPRFYFLHSYFIVTDSPDIALAHTHYGGDFTSAVQMDNIYGTQFHPEKSHAWGTKLLQNFAELQ